VCVSCTHTPCVSCVCLLYTRTLRHRLPPLSRPSVLQLARALARTRLELYAHLMPRALARRSSIVLRLEHSANLLVNLLVVYSYIICGCRSRARGGREANGGYPLLSARLMIVTDNPHAGCWTLQHRAALAGTYLTLDSLSLYPRLLI